MIHRDKQTIVPSKRDVPMGIIISDVVLSNMPRTTSSDSVSSSTDEDEHSVPHFVEISPRNYYEVLESKWENAHGLNDESDKSPQCVSGAPWPLSPSTTAEGLGDSAIPEKRDGKPRYHRRGSLVLTLKKTFMHQEDTVRRESVASPTKPTIPFRRGSIVMPFGGAEKPDHGHNGGFRTDSKRLARSVTAPVRPFRRASLVMNMAHVSDGFASSKRVGYERAEPSTRGCSEASLRSSAPPKVPSRKASMDMCLYLDEEEETPSQTLPSASQSGRESNLVWTVASGQADEDRLQPEQLLYLKLTGFSFQESQDSFQNLRPKVPHRHGSIDMTSTNCE